MSEIIQNLLQDYIMNDNNFARSDSFKNYLESIIEADHGTDFAECIMIIMHDTLYDDLCNAFTAGFNAGAKIGASMKGVET